MTTSTPPQKLPLTPDELPGHQGWTLSDAQRLALPELAWTPNYPGKGFLSTEHENDDCAQEGSFTLMPERETENNITDWRYRLPLPEGKSLRDFVGMPEELSVGDLEWHLRRNSSPLTSHEIGYFSNQAMAVQLLEQMRKQSPGLDIEQALSEAGFMHQHDMNHPGRRTRVYARDLENKGSFRLMVSNINVHLTYEKNRSTSGWTNLMNLYTVAEHHNGAFCPIVWPASIASPIEAAVAAAITLADTWRPEARKKPGLTRS